jgi:hypothetical protein
MLFAAMVTTSLILQCIAVYSSSGSFPYGHTQPGCCLLSIASMATRRLTLASLFSAPASHNATAYTHELVGILGSALMVAGGVLVKPVSSIRTRRRSSARWRQRPERPGQRQNAEGIAAYLRQMQENT